MTRDEYRAKCIEAIADILHEETEAYFRQATELKVAAIILDALHGIACVYATGPDGAPVIGDLTNPPEAQP